MSEMGSHDPFEHLKHKLWPKEGSGVKLAVWLPTIKNQDSTWFLVHVACNIPLESSQQGLQLFFRPHHNQRFARKVMGSQSQESHMWELWDSHLGIPRQNTIWMWASWRGIEYTIRGKVVASPKFGPWWILWVKVCPWWVLTPKMFKLCTNRLVVYFVQIQVND
jgi:hypothetical protein